MKIAIIGAGMAGLTTALSLQNKADVTVFEKSRGVGRMATRYKEAYQFDFGAPYFRAKSEQFIQFLTPYIEKGVVTQWQPMLTTITKTVTNTVANNDDDFSLKTAPSSYPYYTCSPKMTSLGRDMAGQLKQPVMFKTRVASIKKNEDLSWQLSDELGNNLGKFDWVISAMPLEQAQILMPKEYTHTKAMQACKTDACFVLMLAIDAEKLTERLMFLASADILKPEHSVIETIVVENNKNTQLSRDVVSLTIFTRNDWSETQTKIEKDEVQAILLNEFCEYFSVQQDDLLHIDMHRWLYANVTKSLKEVNATSTSDLLDTENKLGVVGDWCVKGSVEGAWRSADNLINEINRVL